jgi:hypothetical protein
MYGRLLSNASDGIKNVKNLKLHQLCKEAVV